MRRPLVLVAVGALLLWGAPVIAQSDLSCEDLRAEAVEQSRLLHEDYIATQAKLAKARVEVTKLKGEVARLKQAQTPAKDEPPPATPEKEAAP